MKKMITSRVKENKKYYKNVIVNIKNTNKIRSLGCIISSYISGNYNISIKFYKIYSYMNEISLENVKAIIKKSFHMIL